MGSRKTLSGGLISCCVWFIFLLCSAPVIAGQTAEFKKQNTAQLPLQFGLLPYMSTQKLFAYYLPIKKYLEAALGRPVRMSTAPDFATYIKRARQGDYDLYHTAPPFCRAGGI